MFTQPLSFKELLIGTPDNIAADHVLMARTVNLYLVKCIKLGLFEL